MFQLGTYWVQAHENLAKALFTSTQNPKIFQDSRHIESLGACMKY